MKFHPSAEGWVFNFLIATVLLSIFRASGNAE